MRRLLALLLLLLTFGDLLRSNDENKTVTETEYTAESSVTTETEAAETEPEPEAESEAESESDEEEWDRYSDIPLTDDDFYVLVTDHEGTEHILYCMFGYDSTLSGKPSPYTYMTLGTSGKPEDMFGYVSLVSYMSAAQKTDSMTLQEMSGLFEAAGMDKVKINYDIDSYDTKTTYIYSDENPETVSGLINALAETEPEYISGLDKKELKKDKSFDEYISRHPLNSIVFTLDTDDQDFQLASKIRLDFYTYNERVLGKISVLDFSDLINYTISGETITAETFEEKYYNSVSFESEWFYAEDTEIYNAALRYLSSLDNSELPNTKEILSYPREGFSEAVLPYVNTDNSSKTGYSPVSLGGLSLLLPDSGKTTANDMFISWTNGDTENEMTFMLMKTNDSSNNTYIGFYFNNRSCGHYSKYNDALKRFEDKLYLYDYNGQEYYARITFSSDVRTDEYDELCKNIFGSFDYAYKQGPETEDTSQYQELTLSETPSTFTDGGIAESYSPYNDRDCYKAYRPGCIAAEFYVTDFETEYETGFECFLEKQEADGNWYRVEPLGDMIQANSGTGEFYHIFSDARRFVTFDLAAYPLLPEGKYRIVKPFWEKGSSDRMQYGAFYEFETDSDFERDGEITATAECAQDTYSSDTEEISYSVYAEDNFVISSIADIERNENGKWTSVRTGSLFVNSIGGSYSMRLGGAADIIDAGGFDLSKSGEYRIRISIGEFNDNMLDTNNYNSVYAYFNVN